MAVLTGCNSSAQKSQITASNLSAQTQEEKILSVEISRAGGIAYFTQKLIITEDSIHYYSEIQAEKREQHKETPKELWDMILKECDVNRFANITKYDKGIASDAIEVETTILTDKRNIFVSSMEVDGDKALYEFHSKIWTDKTIADMNEFNVTKF